MTTAPASNSDAAYRHIRAKLAGGEMEPGARMSNRRLAKELNISFIPVREALGRLESEGLVQHRGGEGAFVADPSQEEMVDLYEVREALECFALAKVAGRLDTKRIDQLREANQRIRDEVDSAMRNLGPRLMVSRDVAERVATFDAHFHLLILQSAGNRRILKIMEDLRILARIFARRFARRSADYYPTVVSTHEQIVDAIEAGDAAAAQRLLRDHLRHGLEEKLEAFRASRLETGDA